MMGAQPLRVHHAVLVTGFGNTGSTSVMDLLRECDGYVCPAQEFFVIQHPDGILALENALVHTWSEFGPDWALRRFCDLVDVLARPPTRLRYGLDYDRLFCRNFRELSDAYVKNLAGMEYDGHLMFRRAEMGRAEYGVYNLSRRLRFRPVSEYLARRYRTLFVTDPRTFLEHTRAYLGDLLASIAHDTNSTDVALLLGASPYQVTRTASYFARSSTVIVERDPRDVYLSALSSSYMPHETGQFIRWYEQTRAHSWQGGQGHVIKVFFEDLVTKYDESVATLFRFLGIDPARHVRKGSCFDPGQSSKRIGKWKTYPRRDEIIRIERELAAYLWQA